MFDSFGLSELSYLDTKQWTQKWNRRLRQPVERQAWLPGQFWREDRGLPISHEECPWLFKSSTILDCSRITLSNEDSGIASSLSCEAMNTIARSFRLIGRGFAGISIQAMTLLIVYLASSSDIETVEPLSATGKHQKRDWASPIEIFISILQVRVFRGSMKAVTWPITTQRRFPPGYCC